MKDDRTPDNGVDAPVAVRNMLIVAALGIIPLITRLLGLWSRQDAIVQNGVRVPCWLAGMGRPDGGAAAEFVLHSE